MTYYQTNDLTIYNGDALAVLKTLPPESVNCVVTSPPYWGLRDYGVDGQMGLESSMQDHLSALVSVFAEVKRVLRNDGTCWINYGDTYLRQQGLGFNANKRLDQGSLNIKIKSPLPEGNILGLPWRLAFALQDDGWILRQDIVWYKPNPMPESVKNRCTKAHEYVFLFVKQPKYYCEQLTELRVSQDNNPPRGSNGTPHPYGGRRQDPPVMGSMGAPDNRNTGKRDKGNNKTFRGGLYTNGSSFDNNGAKHKTSIGQKPADSIFRNKHSVWTVPIQGGFTDSFDGEHYATFPPTLIDPCISAGCPEGGIVLDPFFGSGTVGEVAHNQNKRCIGIELNPDYCAIAKRRLQDPVEQMIEMAGNVK